MPAIGRGRDFIHEDVVIRQREIERALHLPAELPGFLLRMPVRGPALVSS